MHNTPKIIPKKRVKSTFLQDLQKICTKRRFKSTFVVQYSQIVPKEGIESIMYDTSDRVPCISFIMCLVGSISQLGQMKQNKANR